MRKYLIRMSISNAYALIAAKFHNLRHYYLVLRLFHVFGLAWLFGL
jgi:hypothetical protein